MSSAASTGISIASLEVGSATVVFLNVVAEVLIATCKVNIRKSWTGMVRGFKTISLQKLSENKTQTIPKNILSHSKNSKTITPYTRIHHLLRSRDTTQLANEQLWKKDISRHWFPWIITNSYSSITTPHFHFSVPNHGIALPQWPHDEYTRRALTAAGWPQAHPDGSVL